MRLGAKYGIEEIKMHPFFKDFPWEALFSKKLQAPFIPNTEGKNWEKYFEEMKESNILKRSMAKSNAEKYEKIFLNYNFLQQSSDDSASDKEKVDELQDDEGEGMGKGNRNGKEVFQELVGSIYEIEQTSEMILK